jgi:membrane fusion protein, multidrug efflux system
MLFLNRKLFTFAIAITFLFACFQGCKGKRPPPKRQDLIVRTQIVKFELRPRTESLIGQYQASVQSDMSFRISGRIEKRTADVGDRVNVGDVLAQLDSIQQSAGVADAGAALQSVKAILEERKSNMKRMEELLPQGAVSKQEFDDSTASMLTAGGNVKIAEGSLEIAKTQLSYTLLTASVPGLITDRKAEVGQVVGPGVAVYTIAADGGREAVFDVFPADVGDKPITDDIDLSLQSDPMVKTKGVIREISPVIDSVSGTIRVKVFIPSPSEQISLGAPLIGVAQFKPIQLVSLPWTSLSCDGDRPMVWVVDAEKHTVQERIIEVESYASRTILVKSGLEAGEVVVTKGAQMIRPGQKINPTSNENQAEAVK